MAETFVDEHVKFNATVTDKPVIRDRMVAKLQDDIHFSNIEILDMVVGHIAVFFQFKEHVKGQSSHLDKVIEYRAVKNMSLEFDDEELIKHKRRYHGL